MGEGKNELLNYGSSHKVQQKGDEECDGTRNQVYHHVEGPSGLI